MRCNAEGRPYVDLRGCGPRELVSRVAAFLDELGEQSLRDYGAQLVVRDGLSCEAIVRLLACRRIEHATTTVERLHAVVQVLDDLRKENAS